MAQSTMGKANSLLNRERGKQKKKGKKHTSKIRRNEGKSIANANLMDAEAIKKQYDYIYNLM